MYKGRKGKLGNARKRTVHCIGLNILVKEERKRGKRQFVGSLPDMMHKRCILDTRKEGMRIYSSRKSSLPRIIILNLHERPTNGDGTNPRRRFILHP